MNTGEWNSTDWIQLGVALVLSILAMILVAQEAAISAMSRARADAMIEQGMRGAKRVRTIVEDPAPYVNSLRLIRTAFEITAVSLVSVVVFTHVRQDWERLLITIGVMLVVSYIMWGVAPRTLGRQRAEKIAGSQAGVINFIDTILGPIPEFMILIGNALTPGRGFADGPFSSEAELRDLVDMAQQSELIQDGERRMIHSVFELGDTLVKEVMVPRTDVVYIESTKTLRQGMSLALRSGFSRIPVIDGDIDNVVGMVYLKDMARRVFDKPDSDRTETVGEHLRPATFVPDSKPVDAVLRDMQLSRNHVVLIVDEFGGTAGLATIEDVLEEIVGEIVDEYDAEPTLTEKLSDGAFRVSARMPVDDVGELFGLEVSDDDVETIGGLMAKELGVVPIPGSEIDWSGLRIEAEKASGRRHQIDTVLVRLTPTDDDEGDDGDQ